MPGRNDPCSCGSGKKFKKCCAGSLTNSAAPQHVVDLPAAIACFENGNFSKAAEIAEAFLGQYPREPVAWQVRGVSLYYMGELTKAEKAFVQLLKYDAQNADALNNLALVLFEQDKLDAALEHCKKALKIQPGMPGAHNNLGNIYRAMGNFNEAEHHYQAALQQGMQTPELFCNLGTVQQEKGDTVSAKKSYETAVNLDPNFAAGHNNLGAILLILNDLPNARNHLEQAQVLDPTDTEILCNLGKYWQDAGEYENAKQFYQQALQLKQNDVDVNYRIGQFYQVAGNYSEARKYYERAVELNQTHAKSLIGLGEISFAQGHKKQSEDYYQRGMDACDYGDVTLVKSYCSYLLRIVRYQETLRIWRKLEKKYPAHLTVQLGIAEYYQEIADYENAEKIYAKLSADNPDNKEIISNWSLMEESRHNIDKAIELAKKALVLEPDNPAFHHSLAKAMARKKEYTAALEELNKIDLGRMKNQNYAISNILFERAMILDRLKDYDHAYADLIEANRLKDMVIGEPVDPLRQKQHIENDFTVFSQNNKIRLNSYSENITGNAVTPIFIVGFPRSGTTLLEQIITSHSNVSAGDELMFISETRDKINFFTGSQLEYPFNLLDELHPFKEDTITNLRDYYFGRVRDKDIIREGSSMFTDKLPHNLANLGFISLIFPDAPIIHITRHPMDACLSAFMANFANGHRYTSSMQNTVTHYKLLMELAEHFKSVLDMKYMQIRYEDLIDEPENRIRDVLEFIGLPWEDACLNYHQSKRVSKTASYAQVTQKIYTSSRYRYKNYYKHLEPYEPILRETMKQFGYTFEP